MADSPDSTPTAEKPKANEVVLQIVGLASDAHTWDAKHDPITREGTPVPAGKADSIIAAAATQGVVIREVS